MQNLCVQDYQGNNRAVVLNDFYRSSVSQRTHYYPFGIMKQMEAFQLEAETIMKN